MFEKPRRDKMAAPWAVIVAICLVLLPVGYVLSSRPAMRLAYEDWLDADAVLAAYGPVIFVSKTCRPCEEALPWYVSMWLPEPF